MDPTPVEITWSESGIEVVYACDADWLNTRQSVREYLRKETA
jgi:hypothetical protein